MNLGHVQGSQINHILEQSTTRLERFYTLCGIRNSTFTTLTRTHEDRPICHVCAQVSTKTYEAKLPEVDETF